MLIDVAAHFKALAREDPKRIVFPEGSDLRIIEAAATCAREGICRPVVLGSQGEIRRMARDAGFELDGVQIVNPLEQLFLDHYARAYSQKRPVSEGVAKRLVRRNLLYGAMAVSTGSADGLVGGATVPTARVLEAGGLAIGYEPGISVPSSIFIMVLPGILAASFLPPS